VNSTTTYAADARSYAYRQLRRGNISQQHADEVVRCGIAKDEFAAKYDVREYTFSEHNVGKLFRSSGASNEQANPVYLVRGYSRRWSDATFSGDFMDAFDHYDLWGRDRIPLILVGHPYGSRDRHAAVYSAIAGLGLEVCTTGESYYGFGTYQVAVYRSGFPFDTGGRS
jgi:hypothetical protein